ncbi:MAG: hypothetical protein DRP83_09180 [Planctomycetota bacterium]|nr:MAG: hypothetical protein DRP83_09180 [Planctomycetota bacterium]
MRALATARMSSKGQVVIPEAVRNKLGLTAGSQFVVVGENDVVIMKTITRPSMRDFDSLVKKARRQARSAGMTRSDVSKAVADIRGKK